MEKVRFSGTIKSIQPRIRLWRSFDQSAHTYLGYIMLLDGKTSDSDDSENHSFWIAIGEAAQQKFRFRIDDKIESEALPVNDPNQEVAEYYKVSGLRLVERIRSEDSISDNPPFVGLPPTLPEYRAKGHRRLFAKTYEKKCITCIWGCKMPVEIIKDHWKPHIKRYQTETFCYGPNDCKLYVAGPKRRVPGRKSWMVYIEEDEDKF